MSRRTALAATICALLTPVLARGQHEHGKQGMQEQKMPGSMTQLMKMDPEHCMQMMDREHKGFVTKKDFMKFQEQLWEKMDKNRDGKADPTEFTDAG